MEKAPGVGGHAFTKEVLKKIDGINVPSPPVLKSPLFENDKVPEALLKQDQKLSRATKKVDSPRRKQGIAQAGSQTLETLEALTTMYDKDIDLSEEEIPLVLYELNETAIDLIRKEVYERALFMLQKAHNILELISAQNNKRDRGLVLLTLHNMALCYQKLGGLEECSLCLEGCLLNSKYVFPHQHPQNLAQRLMQIKYECKIHMQNCAILSQLHRHRQALAHARESVKAAHQMIKDLCLAILGFTVQVEREGTPFQDQPNVLHSKSSPAPTVPGTSILDFENGKNEFIASSTHAAFTGGSHHLTTTDMSTSMNEQKYPESSRVGGGGAPNKLDKKFSGIMMQRKSQDIEKIEFRGDNLKYPSATLLERTALKQLPILLEILKRVVKEKTPNQLDQVSISSHDTRQGITKVERSPPREQATRLKISGSNRASSGKNSLAMDLPGNQSVSNSLGRTNITLDPNNLYIMSPEQFAQLYPGSQPKDSEQMMQEKFVELIQEADVKLKQEDGRFYVNKDKLVNLAMKKVLRREYLEGVDMRSLVGYLNQNEWIYAINIGNIMQINLLSVSEVYSQNSNGQGLNSNDA